MTEGNGNERDMRLRRIEREHEEFRRDMRNLLTAQVIQEGEIDDLVKATGDLKESLLVEREQRKDVDAALDKRVRGTDFLDRRIDPPHSA